MKACGMASTCNDVVLLSAAAIRPVDGTQSRFRESKEGQHPTPDPSAEGSNVAKEQTSRDKYYITTAQ